MLARFRVAVIAVLGLAVLAIYGCGNESLGKSFTPTPPPDENLGDKSPIAVGTTGYYHFTRTYRRVTAAGSGGLSEGEKQATGYFCTKVAEVRDTATTPYKDAAETVVVAGVKVAGGSGIPDVEVVDQDATSTADPTVVDATMTNLWLFKLLFPSRNHGYASPTNVEFHTRAAPTPPLNQDLSHLLYLDTRTSLDHSWGGWSFYDSECANYSAKAGCEEHQCKWAPGNYCDNKAVNYLNTLLTYMMSTYGCVNFGTGDLKCRQSITTPPANCSTFTAQDTCRAANCTWSFLGSGATGACVGIFSFEGTWRETLVSAPTEFMAHPDVVHKVRLTFDGIGQLRDADEIIVPDINPSGPVPVPLTQCLPDVCSQYSLGDPPDTAGCTANPACLWDAAANGGNGWCVPQTPYPCLTAVIEHYEDPWAGAYCTF
ncbi:MAG: hypothetical protein HY903_14925 [Deltaproteobacteria bacterium]|nr:hypothetical protein [Deltaproteobacteria bacterium]